MAGRSYESRTSPKPEFITLDGVEFRVAGMSFLDVQDWFKLQDMPLGSPEGFKLLDDLFHRVVADYDGFRRHCAEHMTEGRVLMGILNDFMHDAIGGTDDGEDPTQPGESADGPTGIDATSKDDSSSMDSSDAPALPLPETTG